MRAETLCAARSNEVHVNSTRWNQPHCLVVHLAPESGLLRQVDVAAAQNKTAAVDRSTAAV
jgi:hypothetical protein